jgi:hypothetical protein
MKSAYAAEPSKPAWCFSMSATIWSPIRMRCRPPIGEHDQLGSPVGGVVSTVDIAKPVEFVKDRSDRLLIPPRYPGQVRESDAVLVEIGEHCAMPRSQVTEPAFRGAATGSDRPSDRGAGPGPQPGLAHPPALRVLPVQDLAGFGTCRGRHSCTRCSWDHCPVLGAEAWQSPH